MEVAVALVMRRKDALRLLKIFISTGGHSRYTFREWLGMLEG